MAEADWAGLEGVEVVERLLRAALSSDAQRIHLSSDLDGMTVFFLSDERIEFFRHLPTSCRDGAYRYLRRMSAIDEWCAAPVVGFGVFHHNNTTHSVEVQFIKASRDEDVIVSIDRPRPEQHEEGQL